MMPEVVSHLPVLVINAHGRCNCRCVMCDIWKTSPAAEFTLAQLDALLPSIESLGVEWIVFSGGEPLMHSHLFTLCEAVRRRGIRITLLTTGLLIARYAGQIAEHVDDLIVSLDGPEEVHDRIRRVPGGFRQIAAGIAALHALRGDYPIRARCTVQKANHHALRRTCETARELALCSISYLAADVTSTAFGRLDPWPGERRQTVALAPDEIAVLENEITALIPECGRMVADSPAHLARIVGLFRAHAGLARPVAPLCNAPWVSAVIETDGTVRPCFFHPPLGRVNGSGLLPVLNGDPALSFRRTLDIERDATCQRCSCSLYWRHTA
jgi:Fe-coproporphyrin III synthase